MERRITGKQLLIAKPERSNATVARQIGVSPQSVKDWRTELEALGIIDPQPIRVCANGRVQDVSRQYKPPGNQYQR